MMNEVKKVLESKMVDACSKEFSKIASSFEQVNKNTNAAKKFGIVGIVMGTGAMIYSIAVGRQNVQLLKEIGTMNDKHVSDLEDLQEAIDDLEDVVREYDASVEKMRDELKCTDLYKDMCEKINADVNTVGGDTKDENKESVE